MWGVSNRVQHLSTGQMLFPGEAARRRLARPRLGWSVRWLWEDLYHFEELRRRLERAFERGLRAA
jgi:hypothetical protein